MYQLSRNLKVSKSWNPLTLDRGEGEVSAAHEAVKE